MWGEAAERDGRAAWIALADRLLAGARPYFSPTHARITLPGPVGGYGRDVDGLEGFARSFLLAAFRIAGALGLGVDELTETYARGVAAGAGRSTADRWVRLDEHPQAKVEAASIALALDLTRPWIWEQLGSEAREQVIDYLAPVVGDDTYPCNNWLWFRVVVETFLRSVGGPWSVDDIAADLDRHDSFVREDGWFADGTTRAYDHYVGWALHVYPILWARMEGADELAADRAAIDTARLDRYLCDALALVGGDGSPLIQGRSLIYRFAAAAPFWAGAFAGVPSHSPGLLRRAAAGVVGHFVDRGVPEGEVLTVGWHHEWLPLAQAYSGPGSPYWAVKGLLGIALPADHPVWTTPAEPLPIEVADHVKAVRAPGWVISGTRADGIVRVVNHGTDRAAAGSLVGDSPLYARLGYSTATSPLLDAQAWVAPFDQSVTLVDPNGRATHRAAMHLLDVGVRGHVGFAASRCLAHWLTPDPSQHHHGSGLAGRVEPAGDLIVHSLVRGPWELRCAVVASLSPGTRAADLRMRIGGWAVAGPAPQVTTTAGEAVAVAGGLCSRVAGVLGDAAPMIESRADASPLGDVAAAPALEFPVEVGTWVVVLVTLTAAPAAHEPVDVELDDQARAVRVIWPDGVSTENPLSVITSPGSTSSTSTSPTSTSPTSKEHHQ